MAKKVAPASDESETIEQDLIDPYHITIKGARTNNLRNVDLRIPKNQLVVVTGVSGSGKSSITMDTLYAEGQRRYVESLSSYARQFLGRMKKPDVDYIRGICPAIAIEQRVSTGNTRSTVGSMTEVYDFLRLLYARIGKFYSPISGRIVQKHEVSDVVDYIYGGVRFIGFPFELEILSDDERQPRGRVTVQNVDRAIGRALMSLSSSPRLKFEVISDSQFGEKSVSLNARPEIGSAAVEYVADYLALRNVTIDALTLSADIESYDYTSEPWPAIRSTQNRLPGLHR